MDLSSFQSLVSLALIKVRLLNPYAHFSIPFVFFHSVVLGWLVCCVSRYVGIPSGYLDVIAVIFVFLCRSLSPHHLYLYRMKHQNGHWVYSCRRVHTVRTIHFVRNFTTMPYALTPTCSKRSPHKRPPIDACIHHVVHGPDSAEWLQYT